MWFWTKVIICKFSRTFEYKYSNFFRLCLAKQNLLRICLIKILHYAIAVQWPGYLNKLLSEYTLYFQCFFGNRGSVFFFDVLYKLECIWFYAAVCINSGGPCFDIRFSKFLFWTDGLKLFILKANQKKPGTFCPFFANFSGLISVIWTRQSEEKYVTHLGGMPEADSEIFGEIFFPKSSTKVKCK